MSTTRTLIAWKRAAAGPVLLVALPLVALAALRLIPATTLDTSPLIAWSAPVAAAAVAVVAAMATLLALLDALRDGSVASFLNAAGKGVLAGTYAIEAFGGPASAGLVPSAASATGAALAAVLLLSGAVGGSLRLHVGGRLGRTLGAVAVLAVADLALAVVAVGMASGFRRPDETVLRLGAAGLLAVTTVLVGRHARHALSPALLAAGTLTLGLARIGSADVLVGLAALLAGVLVFIAHHLEPASHDRAAPDDAIDGELASAANDDLLPDEHGLLNRMARELHGTINELLQARRTIVLQRAELDRAMTIDELTGVPSRHSILERLRFETAEARRYDHPLAVMLLDIDGLGEINRDHGLAIGDSVLREVALRLRLRAREADAVGRAGGDGFLLILPHTDERGAAVFADTLRQRIGHREILTDAGALAASVSIGVAIVRPGTQLSDEDVLANAVEALSSARAAGGDRIAFDRAHGLARLEQRSAG